jgi:CheY-like chemotaxis protein
MGGTPRRILLVDDYPDALETWGLFLRMKGYTVLTAHDGRTALDTAIAEHPDLIVLDLDLPGMSGVEAAQILRERSDTAAIPLIAATGFSHPAQLAEAERAGFDLILVKPCDPDLLVEQIERLLAPSDRLIE